MQLLFLWFVRGWDFNIQLVLVREVTHCRNFVKTFKTALYSPNLSTCVRVIFANVLSIIQIPSPLPRNPGLTLLIY